MLQDLLMAPLMNLQCSIGPEGLGALIAGEGPFVGVQANVACQTRGGLKALTALQALVPTFGCLGIGAIVDLVATQFRKDPPALPTVYNSY